MTSKPNGFDAQPSPGAFGSIASQTHVITKFNNFDNETFHRYLFSQPVGMYFTNGITNRNSPLKKPSLITYGMSVSSSVTNLLMDLQMDKACKTKSTRFILLLNPSVNLTYFRLENRM